MQGESASNVTIVPIDEVELPDIDEGGNRERLKEFLQLADPEGCDIRGIIDADQGRMTAEILPPNAWVTDFRDLESYVLAAENIDAALRLGCGIVRGSVEEVLNSTLAVATYLAAVRLASHRLGMRLPVSKSEFRGCLQVTNDGIVSLNKQRLLTGLLQSAHVSIRELGRLEEAVSEAESELAMMKVMDVVHGKDSMKLLTAQFRAMGATGLNDAAPLIWSSFKREIADDFPVLQEVAAYLRGLL
jgi:hypothetical protein